MAVNPIDCGPSLYISCAAHIFFSVLPLCRQKSPDASKDVAGPSPFGLQELLESNTSCLYRFEFGAQGLHAMSSRGKINH